MENFTYNKLKAILFTAIVFSLVLEIFYIMGYWLTFSFNIFPFLTLADIINFAAYPLIIIIPIFLIELMLAQLHYRPFKKFFSYFSKKNKKVYCIYSIVIYLMIIVAILLGWVFELTFLYIGLPLMMILRIIYNKLAQEHVSIYRYYSYSSLVITLLLFPLIAFDFGHNTAKSIFNGDKYYYSILNTEGKNYIYKYLGHMKNKYFFIDIRNRKIIIINDDKLLILINYSKTEQSKLN